MTQAILLMLHKDVNQATRLINYFQGKCDIFIHVDKDYKLSKQEWTLLKNMPGVVEVYQKHKVHWAGFSILKTEMFLLKRALKCSNFRYVHLLSGNDYPIKPLSHFLEKFDNTDKEHIACMHMPNLHTDKNTFTRIQNFFFTDYFIVNQDSDVTKIWNLASKLAKWGIRRRIPDEFPHLYNGSQWFSISRECTKKLLKYTRNHPSFYRRMRFAYAPEEIYINTFVMNTTEPDRIGNNNYRYIVWERINAQHPATLTESNFCDIALSDAVFARKIDSLKNTQLTHKIDTLLLTNEEPQFKGDGTRLQKGIQHYTYDSGLCQAIIYICKLLNVNDVIDLGCAPGFYVFYLRKEKIMARGFDGNPYIETQSQQLFGNSKYPCEQISLHVPIEAEQITDMVLLLNVGEYIPNKYQDIVIDNICKLTNKHLIISWYDDNTDEKKCENQEGKWISDREDIHIVNPIKQSDLVQMIEKKGFLMDVFATDLLRTNSHSKRHSKNLLFFRKNG